MSERIVQTWHGWQGFVADIDQPEAEQIALMSTREALDEHTPGCSELSHTIERMDPLPGYTIWGFGEDGESIGSPDDYALMVRLRVAMPEGWTPPDVSEEEDD
jgi:hypothetical protein